MAIEAACHYTLLGVATDASPEEIRAAYLRALNRFKRRHAAGDPLPATHLDTLRAAYRTLSEPSARAGYDRLRRIGVNASRSADASVPDRIEPSLDASGGTTAAPRVDSEAHTAPRDECRVEFLGDGSEYLRIWLVNVALSLLTLGVYSAWAKVRREKYFHRNLQVDGAVFDYHGNPRAILVGRIVLVILFAIVNFAEGIAPAAHLAVFAVAAFVVPWLLVRSLQFRARNTSYRGIRFGFTGTYRQSLTLYLGHGLLTVLTLGIYFPAFLRQQKAFLAEHLRYGEQPCTFTGGVGEFYRGLKLPLILWLAVPLLVLAAIPLIGSGGALIVVLIPLLLSLLVLAINLLLAPTIRVVGTNLLWNHTRLGEMHFRSTQTVRSYLMLAATNWLLSIVTLGFFWPYAQVRLAAYRARNLTVCNPRALGDIAAAQAATPAAIGDEVSDALDFDIAL